MPIREYGQECSKLLTQMQVDIKKNRTLRNTRLTFRACAIICMPINYRPKGRVKNNSLQLVFIFNNLWEFFHEILQDYAKFVMYVTEQFYKKYFWNWQNYAVSTKTPRIFQCFERRLRQLSVGGSGKSRFVGDAMKIQTCRQRELTADGRSNHHWQPRKCLVKLATALLMCSCGGSSQIFDLQVNF